MCVKQHIDNDDEEEEDDGDGNDDDDRQTTATTNINIQICKIRQFFLRDSFDSVAVHSNSNSFESLFDSLLYTSLGDELEIPMRKTLTIFKREK